MARLSPEIHPCLSKEVVEVLNSRQICTVMDFVKADTQQVVSVGRLTFREVLAVKNFLVKKYAARVGNGLDCYRESLHNTAIIPTGIKGVDKILQGGLVTGNIYELCGLPASGKTQFVLTLIKNIIQTNQQNIILLDTKNDFSGTRMKHLLEKLDEKRQSQCLSRILVSRTYTRYDLINALYQIKTNLEKNMKLRVVIIDSLPSILLDSNDHTKNNIHLNHLVNVMRYIAVEHHVVVLITNLIRTWDDSGTREGFSEKIACGRFWFGVPNTRLKIEKTENGVGGRVTALNSDTLRDETNRTAEVRWSDEGFL